MDESGVEANVEGVVVVENGEEEEEDDDDDDDGGSSSSRVDLYASRKVLNCSRVVLSVEVSGSVSQNNSLSFVVVFSLLAKSSAYTLPFTRARCLNSEDLTGNNASNAYWRSSLLHSSVRCAGG